MGKKLIYHLGVDAGFFAEYKYMINAMLYCYEHNIEFTLYSADANFGCKDGWTDYFQPFCPIDTNPMHHVYNYHRVPSLREMVRRIMTEQQSGRLKNVMNMMKWKAKLMMKSWIGHMKARRIYGQSILLNDDIDVNPHAHYDLPSLGFSGTYLEAFQLMVKMTWRFNPEQNRIAEEMKEKIGLNDEYVGCQVRGGDKITEVSLTGPQVFMDCIAKHSELKDVMVLTDDYRIYEQMCKDYPGYKFHTLCDPSERGYVNKAFTETGADAKKKQMQRFLTTISLLQDAQLFVGSITTGPSLHLIMSMPENRRVAIDCPKEKVMATSMMRIALRGKVAEENS